LGQALKEPRRLLKEQELETAAVVAVSVAVAVVEVSVGAGVSRAAVQMVEAAQRPEVAAATAVLQEVAGAQKAAREPEVVFAAVVLVQGVAVLPRTHSQVQETMALQAHCLLCKTYKLQPLHQAELRI
jgi:uncharacterized MAPEG superfamily protein